ncbi:FUN14 domain-containing protein 1 [Uranotaenia lowii]|uniref:FUN14 domain-containing protein 1 n=1 Tax=Uranotaenia lowii TaxID=190385 RepID=UPI00247A4486|nr:FUN14 domain-containing protein 1 [Uranotaenia lowii]
MSEKKIRKDETNKEIINMSEAAGYLDRFVGDVSKKSATKQILIGAGSGWATGYITMKVGKMAAIAVGGGIILLQIANQQGYIQIDWNKIHKKVDKVTDKVEEAVTGQGPSWADKSATLVLPLGGTITISEDGTSPPMPIVTLEQVTIPPHQMAVV